MNIRMKSGICHTSYEKASWFGKEGSWASWFGLDVLAVPLELSEVSGFSVDVKAYCGLTVP